VGEGPAAIRRGVEAVAGVKSDGGPSLLPTAVRGHMCEEYTRLKREADEGLARMVRAKDQLDRFVPIVPGISREVAAAWALLRDAANEAQAASISADQRVSDHLMNHGCRGE
jgi:hypothetical protein